MEIVWHYMRQAQHLACSSWQHSVYTVYAVTTRNLPAQLRNLCSLCYLPLPHALFIIDLLSFKLSKSLLLILHERQNLEGDDAFRKDRRAWYEHVTGESLEGVSLTKQWQRARDLARAWRAYSDGRVTGKQQ